MKELIKKNVEACKTLMLEAERWLWAHPQTGFTEWEADSYLSDKFTELGYTLTKAGNIPGFYTDVDTGRPGPTLCIMGELDALDIAFKRCDTVILTGGLGPTPDDLTKETCAEYFGKELFFFLDRQCLSVFRRVFQMKNDVKRVEVNDTVLNRHFERLIE